MYVAVAHTEGISSTLGAEDVQREKAFQKMAESCVTEVLEAAGLHIPLINCPGKRVKTKKQMKEIEAPAVESRAPQKVQHRPSKQEKRKKSQVDEKIKNMVRKTKEEKVARESNRKRKTVRPGKIERQKRAHTASSSHESGHKSEHKSRSDRR